MSFTETFITTNLDKFPTNELPGLRQRLSKLTESQANIVLATPLKDKTTALLLSFFFGGFGVDRFYIGSIGIGLLKLVLNWFTLGLPWIIDLFFISKATRQVNLKNINTAIATATAVDNLAIENE